jgi:hypothetical protein
MSGGNTERSQGRGLGFGGAVGLGVAVALLIIVIAAGHALAGQLEGAARTVLVFAEIAVCVILGGVALAALAALVYGVLLAWLHLAERRVHLEQLGEGRQVEPGGAGWAVRAEAIEGGAPELPGKVVPALPRADVSAYPRIDVQPHVVTSRAVRPRCAHRDERRS